MGLSASVFQCRPANKLEIWEDLKIISKLKMFHGYRCNVVARWNCDNLVGELKIREKKRNTLHYIIYAFQNVVRIHIIQWQF